MNMLVGAVDWSTYGSNTIGYRHPPEPVGYGPVEALRHARNAAVDLSKEVDLSFDCLKNLFDLLG